MDNKLKVVCAWCKRRLRGPLRAEVVSHGICPPCSFELLRGNVIDEDRFDPWSLWQDVGGEG